ncbi:PAS domain-containing sensor histidine kinase [Sideroxydans lithotrophicus]|uniref:PAS/PAC sensor signal transduction histidine kinase n=1 Tax=Sideroxydans lithotrophicus (strain ES-1) TaxID=580332 RepID=D5CS89_SIDLE|nr:PAS domain S-box protein [Sideroxydans lithotrophicus]ADE11825.1 PAS/PAC sensor signal transduction histidine kinase [Sideroxydans lithotrophicus ES-1]
MPTVVVVIAALALFAGAYLVLVSSFGFFRPAPVRASQHYQDLFHNSVAGIFVINADAFAQFTIEEMNEAATGFISTACQGRLISELVQNLPNEKSTFFVRLIDALNSVVTNDCDLEYGTACWHMTENRSIPLKVRLIPSAKIGNDRKIMGFLQNAGEIEETRDLLTARANDFIALAEQSPDTIARYDLKGHCIYANRAFNKLAAASSQTQPFLPVHDYYGMNHLQRILGVLDSGMDDEMECTWLTATGETVTSHIRLIPEHGATGEVIGVLSIGRDISTLKETERHLRDSRALLRDLTARREIEEGLVRKEMARKMHEEYGQLLSALRMKLAMLSMRYGKDSAILKVQIDDALVLLDGTISHMRDIVSSMYPSVLNTGISSALEWLADDCLAGTGMHYEVHVDEGITGISEGFTGIVFKIVQIALSNVLLHAEANAVAITFEERNKGYRLEVRDDGKGFDLDRSRRNSLGMVAMEELSNMLSGEIVFLSEPGKGTVVEVCFPLVDATQPVMFEAL